MIEGKKISNLDPIQNLQEGCCFPVLSRGSTKRITFSALLNNIISKLPDPKEEDLEEIKETIKKLENQIQALGIDYEEIEDLMKDVDFQIQGQNATILEYTTVVKQFEKEIGESSIAQALEKINKVIPASATEANKLTDKAYVDESIQTSTAVNRGAFNTYADLMAYSGTVTRNDYATVGDDETHNHEAWRYKWNDDTNEWKPEYRINESPMTQAQLAAINSGITAEKVAKIPDHELAQIDDTKASAITTYSSANVERLLAGKVNAEKTIKYMGTFAGLTLQQILFQYGQQNLTIYKGFLDWRDSRCPDANTCEITAYNYILTCQSASGGFYRYDGEKWIKFNHQIFHARGALVNCGTEPTSNVFGIGDAIVTLDSRVARVDFNVFITRAGFGNYFDNGLNRDLLKLLIPELPTITPDVGICHYYNNVGFIDTEREGLTGRCSGVGQFWQFGRMYDYEGNTGGWPASMLYEGLRISGTCYGTY